MVAGRFDFAAMLCYNSHNLQWACKQLVAAAKLPYQLRDCYNLFVTLSDIAYDQGDKLLGDYFNDWRKKLDAPCNQRALFTVVLYKTMRGGKCYDARLLKKSR